MWGILLSLKGQTLEASMLPLATDYYLQFETVTSGHTFSEPFSFEEVDLLLTQAFTIPSGEYITGDSSLMCIEWDDDEWRITAISLDDGDTTEEHFVLDGNFFHTASVAYGNLEEFNDREFWKFPMEVGDTAHYLSEIYERIFVGICPLLTVESSQATYEDMVVVRIPPPSWPTLPAKYEFFSQDNLLIPQVVMGVYEYEELYTVLERKNEVYLVDIPTEELEEETTFEVVIDEGHIRFTSSSSGDLLVFGSVGIVQKIFHTRGEETQIPLERGFYILVFNGRYMKVLVS